MKGRALLFLALSSSFASASIVSTFDTDAEGWQAVNLLPTNLSILESHTAGWSAGHLAESEASFTLPGLFVLNAPSKFLGNLSTYYGSVAKFTLSDTPAPTAVYPSLLLRGNGIAIGYSGNQKPTVAGENFVVPLTESGWFTSSGGTLTKSQFQSVLANLDVFAVNADWTLAGTDTVTLDNVIVQSVPEPATWAGLGLGIAAVLRRRKAQRPVSK